MGEANARSLNVALLGHSSVDEDFTYAFGLYRIQAYLRSLELGHSVEVIDRKVTDDEEEDLARILATDPAVVGLSAYLWNLPRITRLVDRLRATRPDLLIVVGGPSATGYDDLATTDARPDFLVVGPGEQAFANILQAYAEDALEAKANQLGKVISYQSGTRVELAPTRKADPPTSLDFLPSPYLMGLVEVDTKTLYVETDRGCPYSCAFCIESTAPNKVSEFSMERVEAELRWALERGFEHIEMCSAILNRDSDWLESFVELVERLDPEKTLTFSAALYTTYVDERQADLLQRLNLDSILFGLNSTNSETFKSVRRVIRLERFRKRVELVSRFKRPEVSLIMGLPGDTPEGFAKTLDFASTLEADVMVFRFMVLPATIYYERREDYQLEIDFENDNRILSTHSYTREDFAKMESIAREAGFEEVNPGQWIKRKDTGMAVPKMTAQTWAFLQLVLKDLNLENFGWPGGWSFEHLALESHSFARIKLAHAADSRSLDVLLSQRDDDSPRFAHSAYFNLVYREREGPDDDGASLRPLLEGLTQAIRRAESLVLARHRGRRRQR